MTAVMPAGKFQRSLYPDVKKKSEMAIIRSWWSTEKLRTLRSPVKLYCNGLIITKVFQMSGSAMNRFAVDHVEVLLFLVRSPLILWEFAQFAIDNVKKY